MLLQLALTLILASVVASVAVGAGNRCCTPKKWQGQQVLAKGFSDGRTSGQFAETYDVFYDADSQKIAKIGKRERKDRTTHFRVIEDYKAGKVYRINLDTDDCEVGSLESEFSEICVSDKAHRLQESYFGAANHKLTATAYEMAVKDADHDVRVVPVMVWLDYENCVPVSEDITGKIRGNGIFVNINTFGIVADISDPSVFDPPSYCNGKSTPRGDDYLTKFSMTIPGDKGSKRFSLMELFKDDKLYY